MEKRVCIVLGMMIMLVVSCHVSYVQCRVLRADGCKDMRGSDSESSLSHGMTSFAVSSNNATNSQRSSLIRSLPSLLASGPSRKGPGH